MKSVGGICTIEPVPSGGTCARARIPMPQEFEMIAQGHNNAWMARQSTKL